MKKVIWISVGVILFLTSLNVYAWKAASVQEDRCAFCDPRVLNAQTFYEDQLVMALYTHKPILPGHSLIIPKRHVERFEQLTDEEMLSIFHAIQKVHSAVTKVFGTSSYLLLQKNGLEVGQTVPHLHVHYIPRATGQTSTLKFLFQFYIAGLKKPISSEEMQKNVLLLRDGISDSQSLLRAQEVLDR